MKKITALILVLVITVCSVISVSAGTVTTNGGSEAANVIATYIDQTDVYSINLSWGAMTYTYTQTWDAVGCVYNYAWTPTVAGTSDKITVSSSSDVAIKATFAYAQDITVTGVSGVFSNGTINLAIPNGTPTTGSSILTVSGSPSSTSLSGTKVGDITVTIEKQAD